MNPIVVLYSGWYDVALCRACPSLLFVFGDNMLGFGKGGQAIIRAEPNAVGVPTKRKPSMGRGSFFDESSARDLDDVLARIHILWDYLEEGSTLVIPTTTEGEVSLGLERARLKEVAPSIYNTITNHVQEMCNSFGKKKISEREDLVRFAIHGV